MTAKYYAPKGGHPGQDQLLTDRAVFKDAYALIPKGTMRDIVTSFLPHWDNTRLWVIARPMTGFAETFSQYIMEVAPGGYAFLPPACDWTLHNTTDDMLRFHWIRKTYEPVEGIPYPEVIIANENDIPPTMMPNTDNKWGTTRFVDPTDLRHDMHVTIVTFEPGGVIPFLETHVMEHGLYVLEGKAAYRLNDDWVEVEAGDYMWLRAFCPQACYAGGPGRFRYLLYKDVNRHMGLRPLTRT